MQKDLAPIFISGLLASALFCIVFRIGLGFPFMFLPSLPLFSVGLSRHPRLALAGGALASLLIMPLTDPMVSVIFFLFLVLPVWYIIRQSLVWRDQGGSREWKPLGIIFTDLTLYGCATVAIVAAFYATQAGGLPAIMSRSIHTAFAEVEDTYGDMIDTLAGPLAFMVFSFTIWLWGLTLYAHGWLAQKALKQRGLAIRPDFAMTPFLLPHWLLPLLGICALASLIGSPTMAFLGKSTLLSLMFPYFLQGAAMMHQASKTWPSRRFFLFFVYLLIFAQFWPALGLSGIALWQQIKRLSAGQTSSKK